MNTTLELINQERRNNILNGELTFPKIVLEQIIFDNPIIDYENTLEFWEDLWYSFLRESRLSTEVYMDKFNNNNVFNSLLFLLTKYGWIISEVESNYGYIELQENKILQWINKDELKEIRMKYKTKKYKLRSSDKYIDNFVKIQNKIEKTGLTREGFATIMNNTFTYDKALLKKYLEEISNNLLKGLTEDNKQISYEEVVFELLGIIGEEERQYSTERFLIDSRGRAIPQCLKRIANPISSKDMRALMVIPSYLIKKEDTEILNHIFLFVAELNGYKCIGKTLQDKINEGFECYSNNIINPKPNGDSLYEYLWLNRIYAKLDEIIVTGRTYWDIPIEIDATASAIQFMGILTNNHEYLNKTNVIGNTLEDIWTIDGLSRNMVKKHFTRQIYGSTSTPKETLVELKIKHSQEDINKLNELAKKGIFSSACNFKDYIINNVNPNDTMNIKIWNDEFYIKCNRFKWEVTNQKIYFPYASKQGLVKRIVRNLNLTPDLNRFKRYFVTLLIHNLDSQVANNICKEFDSWIIPNHDAFLINPVHTKRIKELYTKNLYEIYSNRHDILKEYFNYIGIQYQNIDINNSELKFEDFNQTTILK